MNQTEVFALMRSDLESAGIDPDSYVPRRMTLHMLYRYRGKYKELLGQKLVECSYSEELALRLTYYLAETAIKWGKTMEGFFEYQVDHQAESYGVSGREFLEWLFSREDTDQFMFHLTWDTLGVTLRIK